jgi:hypothetical protein
MKKTSAILSIAAAGMMLAAAPTTLWAESAAPGGPPEFLNGVTCPDPNTSSTPCYDPNASGTKYSGSLAVVFDKSGTWCTEGVSINNVFFNVTLQQGKLGFIATTDYRSGVRPHSVGFCFGDQEAEQAKTFIDLIRIKMVPALTGCTPGACPGFKVKAISNFQYTTGDSPSSGGFSADITIAVQ